MDGLIVGLDDGRWDGFLNGCFDGDNVGGVHGFIIGCDDGCPEGRAKGC